MSFRLSSSAAAGLRALVLVTGVIFLSGAIPSKADEPLEKYTIGFFGYAFGGVPENDARAAFKSWVRVIGEESGLKLQSSSRIFHDRASAVRAANAKQIDILILSSVDYLAIAPQLPRGLIMTPMQESGPGDEYLLICHRDATGASVADFRGATLIRQDNARSLLVELWLESLLHQAALPRPATFFRDITSAAKPAKALLPVYFKQADLCVITATTFQTLCELNPQMAKQVRILSRSPRFASTVIWLVNPEDSVLHATAHTAIANLHQTTSGRQTMILFQFSRVADCSDSILDSTRELLSRLPPEIVDPPQAPSSTP